MENKRNDSHEGVIVIAEYEIESKRDKEFKRISSEFTQALREFPGFLDKQVLHTQRGDKIAYHVLIRFDHLNHLKAWEASEIRKQIRAKLDDLNGHEPKYHYLTGLESWFSLGVQHPIIPPARYKIAILSGISAYFLLLPIFTFFHHYLMQLPLPIRLLIICTVLSLSLTYLIMPLWTRLLAKWLYPNKNLGK